MTRKLIQATIACHQSQLTEDFKLDRCLDHVVCIRLIRLTDSQTIICEDGVSCFECCFHVGVVLRLVLGIPVSRVVVHSMGGDLQDIMLSILGRLGNTKLSMDVERLRSRGILDNIARAVYSSPCGIVNCPGYCFNIVVHSWYVKNGSICGNRQRNIQLLAISVRPFDTGIC